MKTKWSDMFHIKDPCEANKWRTFNCESSKLQEKKTHAHQSKIIKKRKVKPRESEAWSNSRKKPEWLKSFHITDCSKARLWGGLLAKERKGAAHKLPKRF